MPHIALRRVRPTMELDKEGSLVEAVLFLESEPISLNSLVKITELSKEVVLEVVEDLKKKYRSPGSGIELVEIAGGYQLFPKEELWEHLKVRYGRKNENRLSKAAVETLSIIAYSQPITKAEIEGIRGVSADGMIHLLLEREFIKEAGKKETFGKPVMYETTAKFLSAFKLKSIADLPKLEETETKRFELKG